MANRSCFRTQDVLHHFGGVTNQYQFDGAHRMTQRQTHAGVTQKQRSFGYDGADNITSSTDDQLTTYLVGTENRYESDGDKEFEYDINGNLIRYSRGGREKIYGYDYQNRLVSVEVRESGATVHTVTCAGSFSDPVKIPGLKSQ